MVREIIKISSGPSSADSFPSGHGSPLYGDQCEGSVRVVEGAEQGEGKLLRIQHNPFPAQDLGVKWREDSREKRSPSQMVEAMTRFTNQKPGGQYDPSFKSLPYCILCKRGCRCLGPNCMGQEKKVQSWTYRTPPSSTKIPGLEGEPSITLTRGDKFSQEIKTALSTIKPVL